MSKTPTQTAIPDTAEEVVEARIIEEDDGQQFTIISMKAGDPIAANFEAVERYIASRLEIYEGDHSVETEEDYKVAKKQRAAIGNLKKVVDEERKRVKAVYMEPVEAFEAKVADLTAPIEKVRKSIDESVKAYEALYRQRKAKALQDYYKELAPDLVPLVPYSRIARDEWMNRGYSEVKAREDIEEEVSRIGNGELTVRAVVGEDDPQLDHYLAEYFQVLDSDAITRRYRDDAAKRAEVARLEEERKARAEIQRRLNEEKTAALRAEAALTEAVRKAQPVTEETPSPAPAEEQPAPVSRDLVTRWYFAFDATRDQAIKVAQTLSEMGLKGKLVTDKEALQ